MIIIYMISYLLFYVQDNHTHTEITHLNCMILSIVDEVAINVVEATIVLGIWPLSLHSSMVDGH